MTFFAVKHPRSFISCRFSSFCFNTLASCDLFTPIFRLCWFCVSGMDKNKKEKSPWLKSKKKTGPREKDKGLIMDVSSSLRPFPSPHVALNAGLQVASEKISIKTAKQKNSDIELQVYAGNLFAWIIMVYIKYFNVPQRPHTRLFFRISRCRAHRRSHCSFPLIRRSFSARHFARKSEKF